MAICVWPISASPGCRTSKVQPGERCFRWPPNRPTSMPPPTRAGTRARGQLPCITCCAVCRRIDSSGGTSEQRIRVAGTEAGELSADRRTEPPAIETPHTCGVDSRLAEIVDRCLAADPRRGYPAIADVAEALAERGRSRSLRPMIWLEKCFPDCCWLLFPLAVGRSPMRRPQPRKTSPSGARKRCGLGQAPGLFAERRSRPAPANLVADRR